MGTASQGAPLMQKKLAPAVHDVPGLLYFGYIDLKISLNGVWILKKEGKFVR